MNPFTALKNLSPLHFTSLFIFFFTYPVNPSLDFTLLYISTTHFTFYFLSSSLSPTGFHFPNPHFENMHFTMGSPYCPFGQLVPVSNGPIHKRVFPDVCFCFLAPIFQTYFQNNEPLHCPKEPLTISLHFTFIFCFTYPISPSLHCTLLFISTTHFPSLHFSSIFTFYCLHFTLRI